MNQTIQNCYNVFINYIMNTTGLLLSEMQTIEEWLENRQMQFAGSSTEAEEAAGFEAWLVKMYN